MMQNENRTITSLRRTLAFSAVGGLSVPLMTALLVRNLRPENLLTTFVFSMSYALSIGFLIHLVLVFVGPALDRLSPLKAWSLLITNLVICATVGCFSGTAIGMILLQIPWGAFREIYKGSIRICIPVSLAVGVITGFVDSVRSQLRSTELELRTRELERERAEKLAAEARLSSLESRIHPHFLFNALNSVSCLIRENPAQAEELLGRISSLLRFSLDAHQTRLIPLRRELKIVSDYLEIEQVRFGERLRFRIDAPDDLLELEVPPMSIQTLVENSVKYAVAPRPEGGSIAVTASRDAEGGMALQIRDDGPGFTPESVVQGHGIDLLQSRLYAIFGPEKAELSIEENVVRIRLQHASVPAGR